MLLVRLKLHCFDMLLICWTTCCKLYEISTTNQKSSANAEQFVRHKYVENRGGYIYRYTPVATPLFLIYFISLQISFLAVSFPCTFNFVFPCIFCSLRAYFALHQNRPFSFHFFLSLQFNSLQSEATQRIKHSTSGKRRYQVQFFLRLMKAIWQTSVH